MKNLNKDLIDFLKWHCAYDAFVANLLSEKCDGALSRSDRPTPRTLNLKNCFHWGSTPEKAAYWGGLDYMYRTLEK